MCKKGRRLYVAFADFKKAFDSVHHGQLLETLQEVGIKGIFYYAMKAMYDYLLSCMRVNGDYYDVFKSPKGARQGCVLSPTLFSFFINQVATHISDTGKHDVRLYIIVICRRCNAFGYNSQWIAKDQLDCLKLSYEKLKMEVIKA